MDGHNIDLAYPLSEGHGGQGEMQRDMLIGSPNPLLAASAGG